jgi:D-sedoheptulose 7-phosphate isomerase
MINYIEASLQEAQVGLRNLLSSKAALESIDRASQMLVQTLEAKGKIYACGNGGSMCDAMHFAEELSGRYRNNRRALAAVAISDAGHLTCVANDFGYDQVFSRYIEAHGRENDVLLAISTSGSSKNILLAAQEAHRIGAKVIALTGKPDSALEKAADISICTPAGRYADRVQELHIKVIHILIELVERKLFPEIY